MRSFSFRPVKKPLQPRFTVQISTSKAVPTPILSATINRDGDDTDILLGHGSFLKPTFEHLVSYSEFVNTWW